MMIRDEKPDRRKPGSDPERLKIEGTFEDAVRKALRKPKPPEGFPDFRQRQRRPKDG